MKTIRALPWIAATALLGALAGGVTARMLAQKPLVLLSGTWLPEPRPLPPFELTDTSGRPFGNAALQGHPSLLFFGYSACPDICPATLAILRDVQRQNPLASLQLLFITVDPQRDTPVVLSPYLESFSRSILGLTGTPSALSSLMQGLAAAVERQPSAGRDYRLTHSATLYLLDTHGRLAAVYSPPLSSAKLSADLRTIARAAVL